MFKSRPLIVAATEEGFTLGLNLGFDIAFKLGIFREVFVTTCTGKCKEKIDDCHISPESKRRIAN